MLEAPLRAHQRWRLIDAEAVVMDPDARTRLLKVLLETPNACCDLCTSTWPRYSRGTDRSYPRHNNNNLDLYSAMCEDVQLQSTHGYRLLQINLCKDCTKALIEDWKGFLLEGTHSMRQSDYLPP